jgi:hypothetical protein
MSECARNLSVLLRLGSTSSAGVVVARPPIIVRHLEPPVLLLPLATANEAASPPPPPPLWQHPLGHGGATRSWLIRVDAVLPGWCCHTCHAVG